MPTRGAADRWRVLWSPAFVQPLVLTIVGVAISALLAAASGSASCTPDPDDTYRCLGESINKLIGGVLIVASGVAITGLLVGLSSRDSGLAFGAILVAVSILSLTSDALAERLVHSSTASQVSFPIVAIAILVPVSLGFGVGRLVRGNPGT